MKSFIIADNGKIFDLEQRVIAFPVDDFVNEIVDKDVCFICGADRGEEFNEEHIIPKWLLRRFRLFNSAMILPNDQIINYSKYKIPCCRSCNSELGRHYENRLSKILKPKFEDFIKIVDCNNSKLIYKLIYRWMSLLFLKAHLKDKSIRFDCDQRSNSIQNSEIYDWASMHHIHCVARSHYTSAVIEDSVYGSLIILPLIQEGGINDFDYIDSHAGRVVCVVVGDYAIIAVLDDSGFSATVYEDNLRRIGGHRLSPLQLREVIANLAAINLNIRDRPCYYSGLDLALGEYKISAKCPSKFNLLDTKDRIFTPGKFLRFYIERYLGSQSLSPDALNNIEEGKASFLFNDKGDFVAHYKKGENP